MKAIFTIEYYVTDKRFGWSNTVHDKVLAKNQEEAEAKFQKKHPEIKTFTTVNWLYADY